MGSAFQSLIGALQDSPMGPVPTGILAVLFLCAALYMVFGRDQGSGTPLVRIVGLLMLTVVGVAVLSALGFQRPF